MFDFFSSQLAFYLAILIAGFIPGIFLILATRMYRQFSMLELFVLSFGSSIVVIDFLLILLGRSPFAITRFSVLATIAFFSAACFAIHKHYQRKSETKISILKQIPDSKISRHSTFLVITLLFLTIFIKTIYFQDAIFPTATDLGHHMYWTKSIAVTGQLPVYEKAEITTSHQIAEPTPIADFIIGEHLFLAAIALISGAEFISAFPVLVLFLIHIMSVLAIFILARTFFKDSAHRNTISIVALFLIGPLFAIASPQAKFVSGGVIGNDIGNLLIPIIILLLLKAFAEKKSELLAYALFISLGLAYTHHLSTFVFIFLAFFALISYIALNIKTIKIDLRAWLKMLRSPAVPAIIAFAAIFIFLLYTPTYLNTKAIDTAVGAPSKATRTGLTFEQLKSTAGEARFAFAMIGIALLFLARNIKKYNQAFLIGWILSLTVMSLRPDWLFIDIPSNRVASYIVYPTAIVAAYMLVTILTAIKSAATKNKNHLSPLFLLATFLLLMSYVATSGLYDNAQSLNVSSSATDSIQTYAASQYLAKQITTEDVILKDHNYLSGDAWIKLFFMRDYNFPLSRGFFKRYEDETKVREQCTNFMISNPSTPAAQECFAGTRTNIIMIDPKIDSEQFRRSEKFWQVYSADAIGIFYKAL
ncbi:MAG: hypothetical protein HGA36_02985 [Candidatus Moranbacteria bacterium]|nr:hypothetical protein [Candidatus Moranbacteria bacterium]